jgi:GNAT superfamily N-acetyltransferase
MEEAARPATVADLPRLSELARVAGDELRPTRGGEVFLAREAAGQVEGPDIALVGSSAEPPRQVWAGTIDDVVVGYAAAHVEKLADGSAHGVLDAFFVEEGARGVGVGEAMMDLALPWLRDCGCTGVDAVALPGHRLTKNFFEETGFTARLLVMYRRLHD